jgi:hypothetical protein
MSGDGPCKYKGDPGCGQVANCSTCKVETPTKPKPTPGDNDDSTAGGATPPVSIPHPGKVADDNTLTTPVADVPESGMFGQPGLNVLGFCGSAGGGVPGYYAQGSVCLVWDVDGHWGLAVTTADGIGSGLDVTAGVGPIRSDPKSIHDLSGPTDTFGGSSTTGIGPVSVGGDISRGTSTTGQPTLTMQLGPQLSFQSSLIAPAEVHQISGSTSVLEFDPGGFLAPLFARPDYFNIGRWMP